MREEVRSEVKLSSFCVFSLVLLGGTSTGSEVRLKDHTFFGMFSSLSSHPLNGFLSSFSPFSTSGSWKESRQVRYGRRLSKGLWTSKLMVCNRFPTFSCQRLNPKKSPLSTAGPSSVGADLCFHGFSHVYGVPEHADDLQLRDTRSTRPPDISPALFFFSALDGC